MYSRISIFISLRGQPASWPSHKGAASASVCLAARQDFALTAVWNKGLRLVNTVALASAQLVQTEVHWVVPTAEPFEHSIGTPQGGTISLHNSKTLFLIA